MRALLTLGGNNGFATGANNRGKWSAGPRIPVMIPSASRLRSYSLPGHLWTGANQIRELPLIAGDTSGAATAINDRGQAVGISGICDQAVGRYTAIHAVIWQNGGVTDIGNLGAGFWNTPTAIHQEGVVAGFAGDPAFPEGDLVHAFIWTESGGIEALPELPGHVYSEASGVNADGTAVGISCYRDFVDCRVVRWDAVWART